MPASVSSAAASTDGEFVRRVFIVVAIGVLMAALWALSDLLMLLFGSILFGVALHSAALPLRKHFGLGAGVSLLLSFAIIAAVLVAAVVLVGPEVGSQMRRLASELPKAAEGMAGRFGITSIEDLIKQGATASTLGGLVQRVVSWSAMATSAMGSLLIVLFGGIYFAVNPTHYRDGVLKLVPRAIEPNVAATLDDAGTALRRWLGGQLIAMLLVGALIGLGLWMVGVPSPIALGLIAGLAEFVPIVGPIVAAIPAILIASTQGVDVVLLALAVFLVVQQTESNLIAPLIAERTVSISPAVGLFAVVAMGILFGAPGLLLGFPLAVVFDVAVRRLYIVDILGKDVEILGRPAQPS